MASRVQAINLTNFGGGLNLRGDAFELSEGESPDMLNVDIDPRGGFVARKGWGRWNADVIAGTWNPRTLFVHELASGLDRVYVANDGKILRSDDGATWVTLNSTTDIVANAAPHGADFAAWGDKAYIACGASNQSVRMVGTTATRMTIAQTGAFTEYASPSTDTAPAADYIVAHAGYLFAASTVESATAFPHRVRWSHPNNPEAWQADDYIDILEGGGPITGMMAMSDHLLIFKPSSVWALFGYSAESWQLVNISREVGAPHRQVITQSESAAFFFANGRGVYAIVGTERPREISLQLRPLVRDQGINPNATDNVFLGWLGQRLWFSVPKMSTMLPTDVTHSYVFDPSVGDGAWMVYQGGDNKSVGPFAQGGNSGGSELLIAAVRSSANIAIIDDVDQTTDIFDGITRFFQAYYVTKWIDGGFPTLKKSWRRPDFVLKERAETYDVVTTLYRDYDEANAVRTGGVTVGAGGVSVPWGAFTWGDGTLYAASAKGSTIERGGNLGSSRSVQLRFSAFTSSRWGVDAIILKVIPRRLR